MIDVQNQIYPNVIPQDTRAFAIGIPVLCAPFKTMQFSMLMAATITFTDGDGDFVIGDNVTGDSSGATAVILDVTYTDDTHAVGTLFVINVTGTFTHGEGITSDEGPLAAVNLFAIPNYSVIVYKSNQEELPDPNDPVSPDNQFTTVGYTDDSNGVNYNAATPFNPQAQTPDFSGEKIFNVETQGARWLWVGVFGYTSGSVYRTNMELFTR